MEDKGLMQRLSIVIPNFNYAEYVGAAITSALAVDWADLEVIVVDDGSTDSSVREIRAFGDSVQLVRQANAGPRAACNVGFARSTGDWVVFLDSDDLIGRATAKEIDRLDRSGISKIQFQMRRIDPSGKVVGRPFPQYHRVPSPDAIRYWMRATASYPTPPGSGNAYSRAFLASLFPLGDECGDASDSICLSSAPFLGDVLTVPRPLFDYRVHGRNRSYLLADTLRFRCQLVRALQRHEFAQRLDGRRGSARWLAPLFRGQHLLQLRVAHHRLSGEKSPLPGESVGRMLRNCLTVLWSPGPERLVQRIAVAFWSASVLLSPRAVALPLIRYRFNQPR